MNDLKINPRDLKKEINITKKDWLYRGQTNCYAYALGLDIIEQRICRGAYQVGTIGKKYYKISDKVFYSLSIEKRLYLDLEAIGIIYHEIDPTEKINPNSWNISLFSSDVYYDFHFLRKLPTNNWTHKMGWFEPPKNIDDDNSIIYDPRYCYLHHYKYEKSLNLRLK